MPSPQSTPLNGKRIAVLMTDGVEQVGIVRGKRMTSWPSLKEDLRNAGAEWTDAPAVVDGRLVTSRKPDDIPAFVEALLHELAETAETSLA